MIFKMNKFFPACLLISITVWSAAPVWGQSDLKKNLETEDYHLWHKMVPREMASDGNWISFNLYYKHSSDTLVVKNTKNDKMYELPGVRKHAFSENSHWFVFTDNNNAVGIIDLMNDTVEKIADATDFKYSKNNKFLGVTISAADGEPKVWIRNLQSDEDFILDSVYEYEFNNKANALLVAKKTEQGHSLRWFDLINRGQFVELKKSEKNSFKRLTWSDDDQSLVLFEEFTMENSNEKNRYIHWLENLDDLKSWKTFDPFNYSVSKKYFIPNNFFSTLSISKDSKRVFFQLNEYLKKEDLNALNPQINTASVQVWNAADRFVYPAYQAEEAAINNPLLLSAWSPGENKLIHLGDTNYAESVLSPNQKYAVAYSNFDYRPHFKHYGKFTDVYVFDVETGKAKLILEKIAFSSRLFYYSPSGNYLTYFRDGIWWLYDFKKNTHSNLTGNIPNAFYDTSKSGYNNPFPIGMPAWTPDENAVFLTDEFDVWKIDIDGIKKTRLTKGREQHISYQIYDIAESHHNNNLFKGFVSDHLSLNKILLSAKGADEKTGYYFLDEKGLHKITYDNSFVSHLKKGKNANDLVYMKQKFDMPPRLIKTSFEDVNSEVIYQSNQQHYKYNWGHAELLNYSTQDGTQLKGALFYPSNFDPNKKYPVIVHIYEIKSDEIHHYQNPSLYESAWYSFSNFTTQGYFVFFPDIIYNKKGPGMSALNSVDAAMDALIELPFIDEENIGLTGFSFGGYQTCFIISQTDRFKTAVAGTSATNMLSFYLSMAWMWNRSQTWRFETQQWRFGKSYFEIPEIYEQNSPIHHAQNINTPLLTWTGDKDTNVNWEQSVELYNALRRLNKEHIFLLYPNEGHSLLKKENQMDLTIRMREWFDHYLKGMEPAAWMVNSN